MFAQNVVFFREKYFFYKRNICSSPFPSKITFFP
uniref:Uncharacterized protein n=1 Tax=Marseillevirus sp. TaxID=2809551 RepID=A0AA96EJR3_9VIRU|nr:hypothetical protein MarFTMF_019 [Marseillevirus sp.]